MNIFVSTVKLICPLVQWTQKGAVLMAAPR